MENATPKACVLGWKVVKSMPKNEMHKCVKQHFSRFCCCCSWVIGWKVVKSMPKNDVHK